MNNILQNFSDTWCTGCGTCMNVCPTDAIRMTLNPEGFLVPAVSPEQCIGCGQCIRCCPAKTHPEPADPSGDGYYLFQGSDEVRLASSSGGAFHDLAEAVLQAGGVVFGAVYDPERRIICHASTETHALADLQRSKYAQSYMGNTFRQVRAALQEGRSVLFSGTPCQVDGLHRYLKKAYSNLLTVDFVCHGVPGTGFFRDFLLLEEQKTQKSVADVTFREKDLGWREQVTKLSFTDGTETAYKSKEHPYYLSFLQNLSLRKSCFTCSMPEHYASDITLLDYWESKDDDNKGISGCAAHTEKGKQALERLAPFCTPVDSLLTRRSTTAHSKMTGYRSRRLLRRWFCRSYAKTDLIPFFEKKIPVYQKIVSLQNDMLALAVTCRDKLRRKGK